MNSKKKDQTRGGELLWLRWMAGQVVLLLDQGSVHIQNRKGDKQQLKLIDGFYRASRKFADFSYLNEIEEFKKLANAQSRCRKLLYWRN